jgi:hypothetical protein
MTIVWKVKMKLYFNISIDNMEICYEEVIWMLQRSEKCQNFRYYPQW